MVAAAVDLSVLVEVDQVHQQLAAGRALEALGVPAAALTSPTGKHSDISPADLSAALEKINKMMGWVEMNDRRKEIR